jgi:hypothetical protein
MTRSFFGLPAALAGSQTVLRLAGRGGEVDPVRPVQQYPGQQRRGDRHDEQSQRDTDAKRQLPKILASTE